MAKRLTDKQKDEMIESFKDGKTIEFISQNLKCTKLTISRNLKKILGDKIYNDLIQKNSTGKFQIASKEVKEIVNLEELNLSNENENESDFNHFSSFVEITPLDYEIDNSSRKELSSIPISEVEFPQIVYMIVDKQIELEIKFLKDYPEWQFLPFDDLNRKAIAIYSDLKTAKRFCNKDQKVIKVPNTNVFKIVAPILASRGISRIVSWDKLIAL